MLFTIVFVALFCVKNKNNDYFQKKVDNKKVDNKIEITIDNIDYNSNPMYSDDYWGKIYKELVYYCLKCIGILFCVYFDLSYINYVYLQE